MNTTEEMVKKRTVWEKLKNIQIFSGLGDLFFAFKSLDLENPLDITLHDFLKTDKNDEIYFERDIMDERYKDFKDEEHGIFNYYSMPMEFYLKKIYRYSKLAYDKTDITKERRQNQEIFSNKKFVKKFLQKDENTQSNLSVNDFEDVLELIRIRKLFSLWTNYKENAQYKNVIDEYYGFESLENTFRLDEVKEKLTLEELEFLDILYKTKTFDNGRGIFYIAL